MSFTYNIATDAGKVRLLITDTNSAAFYFDDTEIQAFLDLESGSVRRAAALGLETLASNQTLILKWIRISNLQTNGPAVSKDLRERATALRAQADFDDSAAGTLFDWAEQVTSPEMERQRLYNEALRNLG